MANNLRVLHALARDPAESLTRLHEEYGSIVRIRLGSNNLFLISEPSAIHDILVVSGDAFEKGIARRGRFFTKNDAIMPLRRLLGRGLLTSVDDIHQSQHRLIRPLFHHQRLVGYGTGIVELTQNTASRWVDSARIDLHEAMSELTLAIAARSLLTVDLDSQMQTTIRARVPRTGSAARSALLPGGRILDRLSISSNRRFAKGRQKLDATISRIIGERRSTEEDREDLVSLLQKARRTPAGLHITDSLIRDEVLTILLAGHETIANALTWAYQLLGDSPGELNLLHGELKAVLNGRPPGIADLSALVRTNAILREALRLYPPAAILCRRLLSEHIVGGYRLPANTTVILSPWVVHRDGRWWPDPERFAPARWLDSTTDSTDSVAGSALAPTRPTFAYFPFGGGRRRCIGDRFALMEGLLIMATISQHWILEPIPRVHNHGFHRASLRPEPGLSATTVMRMQSGT